MQVCVLDVPAAAQEFDNSASGGSATDSFIIYKLVQGRKSFKISSPFRVLSKYFPGDLDCRIKYTIVLKGTDTLSNTEWPEIYTSSSSIEGYVYIVLEWKEYKWRETHE